MPPPSPTRLDHAPEVGDYLRRSPAWLLRYGTLLLSTLLTSLFLLTLYTGYPATAAATFTLPAPAGALELTLPNPLIVQRLLVSQGQEVEAGQTLVVGRDDRLRYDQVLYLEDQLLTAASLPADRLAAFPIPIGLELGPLQQPLTALTALQSIYSSSSTEAEMTDRLLASLDDLRRAVADWKQSYTVVSPAAGRVQFPDTLRAGDLIEQGHPIAIVVPDGRERPSGTLTVPLAESGRLAVGQSVLLDPNDWPALEYGALSGTIVSVDHTPGSSWVRATFELTTPALVTATGRRITTNGVLSGQARIIVGEQRLVDKMF